MKKIVGSIILLLCVFAIGTLFGYCLKKSDRGTALQELKKDTTYIRCVGDTLELYEKESCNGILHYDLHDKFFILPNGKEAKNMSEIPKNCYIYAETPSIYRIVTN